MTNVFLFFFYCIVDGTKIYMKICTVVQLEAHKLKISNTDCLNLKI